MSSSPAGTVPAPHSAVPFPGLRALGVLLAVGGVHGLVALAESSSTGLIVARSAIALAALGGLLFAAALAVGVLLVRLHPLGRRLAPCIFGAQLLWLEQPSGAFHWMAGAYAFADLLGTSSAPVFGVGGSFHAQPAGPISAVALNWAALLMMIWAAVGYRDMRRQGVSARVPAN